ncbi:Light-harvesting complex [Amphidinium carterae]
MSLSKPIIAVASFAAAASPAAAFQSAGNVVHRPSLTGRETRSQTSASTDMVSSSVSTFSSGLAVSGVATLAAAAVMASSTRHVPKPNAKTAMAFFGGAPGAAPSFDPSKELGVQEPLGFWDPAGFMKEGDEALFRRYRQTEIKHGRVAMLATMGFITPEITGKLPGYLSPSTGLKYEDIPNGLGAISKVPALGWAQMIAYAAFCELSQDQSPGTPGAKGDLGFKVLTSSDPVELEKKLSAEIANGRLAMMAIIGMFFQDGLTGSAWGDWANYTASPLRAFDPSKELGAMAPLGFWDPAGFVKVGDEAGFRNLRAAEIKHGRVAMMAAVGAVVQHYVQIPGFESVPKGLSAVTTAPGTYGFAVLFIVAGLLELGAWTESPDKEPGNFGDPVGLNQYTEEMRLRELNNGRFAMFAAIGIFAAELYTGLDAVEQLSPLRAFDPSKELGAMAPLGFWDPAGFVKVGDEAGFRNLRAAEIKHGRVAMMAAVGAVVQHYVQIPGFESVPKGLSAVTTAPGTYGFAVLFIVAGLLELGAWTESPDKEPGNFGDPVGLNQYTEEMRLRELNNGRFAMFAAIGIIAAELYTGLDAVEQLSV